MLIELRIHYKDGTIAHNLIQCDDPAKWEEKNILTNIADLINFHKRASVVNNPVVKVTKKCVLACKTNFKIDKESRMRRISWCSGHCYSLPEEWWKMI